MAATITAGTPFSSISSLSSIGRTVTASIGDMVIVFVAVNNTGTNGVSPITNVTDTAGNTYTTHDVTYDPGAAGVGATLGIFYSILTSALSAASVTCNFNVNVTESTIVAYRVQPGAGETLSFIANGGAGVTGNLSSYSIATGSITSGDIVFGACSIETDDAITADTDTTNGNWSANVGIIADAGADAVCQQLVTQYKVTTGTGVQTFNPTSATARDAAVSYIVIRSVGATTYDRAAVIDSVSTLTVARQNTKPRAAVMASVSTLSVVGQVLKSRAVVIASASSLTAVARLTSNRAALAASVSSLTALAKVTFNRATAMSSASTLIALGTSAKARAAAMASASSLTATALLTRTRAVAIGSVSTMTAAATVTTPGGTLNRAAQMDAVSSFTATPKLTFLRIASINGVSQIDATATVTAGAAVSPVTTAGRRSAATSYSYKTIGKIRREKERELAKIARRAQRKVEAAMATEPSLGLTALVRQEVAATAPKGVQWLSPAMLNGIVESIVAYHRAQMERDLIRRQQEDEEDDIEALLLAA